MNGWFHHQENELRKRSLFLTAALGLLLAALALLLRTSAAPAAIPVPDRARVAESMARLRDIYLGLGPAEGSYENYLQGMDAAAYEGDPLPFPAQAETVYLSAGSEAEAVFEVNAPQDALYALSFRYRPEGRQILPTVLRASLDGGMPYEEWSRLRADDVWTFDGFPLDRYGNETQGMPRRQNDWQRAWFRDSPGRYSRPLQVFLSAGSHRLALQCAQGELSVSELALHPIPHPEASSPGMPEGEGLIVIEAERMDRRSNPNVRPAAAFNSRLSPYSPDRKVQNHIEDSSFRYGGARVAYDVHAPRAGWYRLMFNYRQSVKDGFTVFRSLYLDGAVPGAQFLDIPFGYARQFTRYSPEGVVYLSEGPHTLELEVSLDPTRYAVMILEKVIGEMNDLTLEITRMSGGNTDRYRDFDLRDYGIDAAALLSGWADTLEQTHAALDLLKSVRGACGEIEQLRVAAQLLRILAREPEELPKRLAEFSRGITSEGSVSSTTNSNSVLQYLVNTNQALQLSELGLDRIILYQEGAALPPEKGWVETAGDALAHFGASFGLQEYTPEYSGVQGEALQVWVARPRQYLEIMQNLADTRFTPQTGIKVDLSIVPDQSKLILANASGKAPDAAIAIASGSVYDLAIRGALANLRDFDTFKAVGRRFPPGLLIPGVLDEGVYAIPETFNFWVLFYRADILDALGLQVPDSLDEVRAMLPRLRRAGMNFNSQVSNFVAKPYAATAPFFMQAGADVYLPGSWLSALSTQEAIRAMTLMAENYTVHSMQYNISSFYQYFRDGRTPVGVSDYGSFNLMTNAAPELAGKWGLALYPGIRDEKGRVQRFTSSAAESCVVFASSSRQQEAWAFLDWWMSTEIQADFSFLLQTALGNEYMWNSANLAALEQAAWNPEHKAVILEQLKWTKEIPRVPGGYMAEREISNALDAVIAGRKLQSAIDHADRVINREIKRKLEEFGYTRDGRYEAPLRLPSVQTVEDWLR